MALWKLVAVCAALTFLGSQCMANNRWWEDYFRDMDTADSDSDDVPWWEQYRWWESTEDMQWDEESDRLVASGELSGPGVCSRDVMETRYYYENVTYPCWEWMVVPCPSNYNNGRRNRRVKRGSGRRSHICYSYRCETCTKQVRRCGYETVTEKYCCQGYQQDGNGGCSRSIQCGNNNGDCSHLCKTDGQNHMCECFPGFNLVNGTKCIDRNECATGEAGCNHFCKNSIGSFYCGCRAGFALMGPNICEDIDECQLGNGGCEHECVNTHGGFYCQCEVGYQLEKGYMCEDVNECELHNGGCSHECENLDGTYKCHCPNSTEELELYLGNDHKTCLPLEVVSIRSTLAPGVTEFLPEDLPFVNTADEREAKSGVNGALVGGIVGAVIGLGLLALVAVGLAKYFGVPCLCVGAGAAAAGGASENIYETPTVLSIIPEKKGFCDAGKGPSYTDLAFDNNVYGRRIEQIAGVASEPPAYCEADPVESPYSDVAPPMYDNIGSVTAKMPSAPVEYDNLEKAPIEYDNFAQTANDADKKAGAFDNKTYEQVAGPSAGDIINAKNCLKSTGSKLA